MPSPFPGMDPYIEDPEIWGDFHLDLAAEIRTRLNQIIQPTYMEPDPDAPLDLAAMVADIYVRGGYATLIDYKNPPPPPKLSKEQLAWVDNLLQEQGVR